MADLSSTATTGAIDIGQMPVLKPVGGRDTPDNFEGSLPGPDLTNDAPQSGTSGPVRTSPTDKEMARQGCKTCEESTGDGGKTPVRTAQQSTQAQPSKVQVAGFFPRETKAALGNLIWYTVAGLILFLVSQIFL